MNGNNPRLRANAAEWIPNSAQVNAAEIARANRARANLMNRLSRMFGQRRGIRGETLIPRQNNPVYNAPPVSEEAFNAAIEKLNTNMALQQNMKNTLMEANFNRRWNEPTENNKTPITNLVRNISKTARLNTNAANWNALSKNINAERAKSRRANRKNRKTRRANRKDRR